MELHEKIAETRKTLMERGFCKNWPEDEQGRVCIRGAIAIAMTGTTERFWEAIKTDETDRFLADFAKSRGYVTNALLLWMDGVEHVVFNNAPETTEKDVLDFLYEAEIAAKELMK